MDLKLLNDQGQAATFSAPDTLFGRDFNEALVHQVVVAYQANARPKATALRRIARKSSTRPRSRGARRAPAALVPV